jgi:hypothetical protein
MGHRKASSALKCYIHIRILQNALLLKIERKIIDQSEMGILLVRKVLLFLILDFFVEIVGFEEYRSITQNQIRLEVR